MVDSIINDSAILSLPAAQDDTNHDNSTRHATLRYANNEATDCLDDSALHLQMLIQLCSHSLFVLPISAGLSLSLARYSVFHFLD